MSEAPEKIRASLTACRDGWHSNINLSGGQRGFPMTPYIREGIHEAVLATNRELVAQIAKMHSDYGPVIEQVDAQTAAIKREGE